MTRGPIAGNGKSHKKVLAVLRAAGTEKDGRPVAIRSAVLAERAGISHANLSKIMDPLLANGQVLFCEVKLARGRPTREFRLGLGLGIAQPAMRPLDTRRHGVASAPIGKPLPVTTAGRQRGKGEISDTATLERIQAMSADAFGDYVAHLSRVWAYGQTRMTA
jgi:hypothetical protein